MQNVSEQPNKNINIIQIISSVGATVVAGILTVGMSSAFGAFMKINEVEQQSEVIVDKLDELQIEIVRDLNKLESDLSEAQQEIDSLKERITRIETKNSIEIESEDNK